MRIYPFLSRCTGHEIYVYRQTSILRVSNTPLGGNRIEITLSGRKRGYGGMKLDPIVVEKR